MVRPRLCGDAGSGLEGPRGPFGQSAAPTATRIARRSVGHCGRYIFRYILRMIKQGPAPAAPQAVGRAHEEGEPMAQDQTGGRDEPSLQADAPSLSQSTRPDVGLRRQFAHMRRASAHRYDPSLDPALSWDASEARDRAEALLADISALVDKACGRELDDQGRAEALGQLGRAAQALQGMSRPLLNWTGKAERHRLDLPVLPLFIHERLSAERVLEAVRRAEAERSASGGAEPSPAGMPLRAYEHPGLWTNRLVVGDSLLVMNSLLDYEGMGGQVQVIYMDPPYRVRLQGRPAASEPWRLDTVYSGRDLAGDPERVRAYRDTWELGIHSYLTYLRDRVALCRSLLAPTGSLFVRTSQEHEHHVGEVLDEVFGGANRVAIIAVPRRSRWDGDLVPTVTDYVLWYAKDRAEVKYRPLYRSKQARGRTTGYTGVELADGTRRMMTAQEAEGSLPAGARRYRLDALTAPGARPEASEPFAWAGRTFQPGPDEHWKVSLDGLARLAEAGRLEATAAGLHYVRYGDDAPWQVVDDAWWDVESEPQADAPPGADVVQRCLLMTTDPGDLVFDPTCGGGTTALMAEHWGRRWITADVSRVALALARQRLLTATFPWWQLKDPARGPGGGFVYTRRQDDRGQEVGGIVPRITLQQVASGAAPESQVRVDHPDRDAAIVRVSAPFTVEAVMPPALSPHGAAGSRESRDAGRRLARILESLRGASVLTLAGGERVEVRRVRAVGHSGLLHAEADVVSGGDTTLAAFFVGPDEAPVTEGLVWDVAQEAERRGYGVLYLIGFALEDAASRVLYRDVPVLPLPVVYVQASADLLRGDVRTTAGIPVLSVIGAPDIQVTRVPAAGGGPALYRVELLGLDVFDPMAGSARHGAGADVPCWMLDSNYDERAFRATQVFFPRTHARAHVRRALGGGFDDRLWERLGSTVSAPFAAGAHHRIAVKVIDDRGNELLLSRGLATTNEVT